MATTGYKVGSFLAKHIVVIFLTALVGALVLTIVPSSEPTPVQAAAPPIPKKSNQEIAQSKCDAGRGERLTTATKQLSAKHYDDATTTLEPCLGLFTASEKSIYLPALKLGNEARSKAAALEKKKEKARRKKQGVTLGMSQQDVLDSSWGRPNQINKTTNTWGTSEQWVYGGGYLYFDNGVLKTIQH